MYLLVCLFNYLSSATSRDPRAVLLSQEKGLFMETSDLLSFVITAVFREDRPYQKEHKSQSIQTFPLSG